MGPVTGDSKPENPFMLKLQNLTANGVLQQPNSTTKKVLSFDEICQTAEFVHQSQSRQPPGNVSFVVQPVPVDEIPGINISFPSSFPSNFGFGKGVTRGEYGLYAGYVGSSDPQAQLTVRSMASIELGSSNCRKIHLRRVHTTAGTEAIVSPIVTDNNSSAADAIALVQNNNGDTVHSHWPFSPLFKVNGKTVDVEQHHHGDGRVLGSSKISSSSSSSVRDVAGRKKKKKKKGAVGQRRTHHQNGQVLGSRLEFIFSCVSLAAGLGNIWKFPYIAFKSGGGGFLIPYNIMGFLCGMPTLELAVGQYTREGAVGAMRSICPLFSGDDFGISFTTQLPWTHFVNSWNTEACRALGIAYIIVIAFLGQEVAA